MAVIPKYTGGVGDYTKQGVRYSQRVLGVYGSAYKGRIYGRAYIPKYTGGEGDYTKQGVRYSEMHLTGVSVQVNGF